MGVSEPRFFAPDDLDGVVAVLFELVSQLHEERAQRLELEARLDAAGLLPPPSADVRDRAHERSQAELAAAVERIVRIVSETGPPQHPLRDEARTDQPRTEVDRG